MTEILQSGLMKQNYFKTEFSLIFHTEFTLIFLTQLQKLLTGLNLDGGTGTISRKKISIGFWEGLVAREL